MHKRKVRVSVPAEQGFVDAPAVSETVLLKADSRQQSRTTLTLKLSVASPASHNS